MFTQVIIECINILVVEFWIIESFMKSRLEKVIEYDAKYLPAINKNKTEAVRVDEKCPIFNYIHSLNADTSKQTATRCLQAIARHNGYSSFYDIDWREITSVDINSLINTLKAKNLSPKSISLYVSIVKSVCEHAYLLDQISRLQLDGVLKVKGSTGSRIKKHKIISRNEFEALLNLIETGNLSNRIKMIRDKAIFHLLIGTGLRRNELANIQISSLDLETNKQRTIISSQYLKIIGKGNKERYIALHPVTKAALEDWINIRGTINGPIFMKVSKSGSFVIKKDNALTGNAIYELCRRYNTVAPHSLRRSYATWLDEKGVKISRISKLLGHAKEVTTALYIVDDEEKAYEDVLNSLF
ncbi:site-specific integrase (plasmid) [Pseudoalteromonas sp. KG3]|uniref:tyrosine-type recombinase/integrase n=1 Tax=Pseudoalteromonas TaxID=53246 RepID=UPI0026598DDD|nr:site-specific integrase [Pseudoalteromonas sp. KG3]WKD26448.1 site-specific integrase [Pseudoalteromonas sp. KG3]